jgi:hypothetical protein
MAKKKTKKLKIRNIEGNRIRRIKTEVKKSEKKMNKLLKRHKEDKKGLVPNSERHKKLKAYIGFLKNKLD